MIIDFHTHYYPDKIVDRAMASVQGLMTPAIGGARADLERSMELNKVDFSVLLPLVNTPGNCLGVNTWAKNESHGKIIALGSIHPEDPQALEHLKMIRDMGFCGIKVHPEYQHFKFNNEKFFPIWEKCADLGLFVLTHAGFDIKFEPPFKTNPKELAEFHHRFPQLTLVLAHFGSMYMYDEVEQYLLGEDVYLDLAFTGEKEVPSGRMSEMIKKHGVNRVLFGTDSPWRGAGEEIRYVRSLDLSEAEKEQIFSGNARKLLQI